jgi:hypothetical protein
MKIQPVNTPADGKPLVLVTITVNKIEDVMNEAEKKKTGISTLNAEQLKNLNDFLDGSVVVGQGPISH